jgi:hypothetical protein
MGRSLGKNNRQGNKPDKPRKAATVAAEGISAAIGFLGMICG